MMANTVNRRPAPSAGRPFAGRPFADEVTVCVPGSMLAAAPAAEAPPVFVDDSGARRKLIRATGCILMLLLVGFLGVVGVALALPSVGANVALGNVTPFLVPGAAAKPPPPAPVAFVTEPVQNVAPAARRPAPKPKPKVVAVAKPAPKKEKRVAVQAPVESPASAAPVVGKPVEPPATEPTTGTTGTGTTGTGTTGTGTTGTGTTGTGTTGTGTTGTGTTGTGTTGTGTAGTGTTGTGTTGTTTTDPATDPAAPAAANG